jgi:hypothetical protein
MRYIHDEEDDAIAIADIMERGIALASKPALPFNRPLSRGFA